MRGFVIAALWVVACNPDFSGMGTASIPATNDGDSTATSTAVTTGTTIVSTTEVASGDATQGQTESTSSTSASTATSTTGSAVVCGQAPSSPGGECDDTLCAECMSGECEVDCADPVVGICMGQMIMCDPGRPCMVTCGGEQACKDSTIVCPDEHECMVSCSGEQACQTTFVECGAGPCLLRCNSGQQVCQDSELRCGDNEGLVTCNGPHEDLPTIVTSRSDCDCMVDVGCREK